MIWFLPLCGLILFECIANVFAKEYSLSRDMREWFFAMSCYVICNSFWLLAMRNGVGLARGAIYFSLSSTIISVCIGVFYYKEIIAVRQMAGLILGLIAIVLLTGE